MSNIEEKTQNICGECSLEIKSFLYVRCHHCYRQFHFSPCCSLSESSYKSMSQPKRSAWKCKNCSTKSPNVGYLLIHAESEKMLQQLEPLAVIMLCFAQ